VDWNSALKPLFKKYSGRKHPLEYKNPYQLLVMVVLSARSSDQAINALAPILFAKIPSIRALARATPESLSPYIRGVTNFRNKAAWLTQTAKQIKTDANIPRTLKALTELPGIGRKSANVILSQINAAAEGVIVDLHTLRVAPRLGIAKGTSAEKIEEQLMSKVLRKNWHLLGMSLTYLGRESCRPTNPNCPECVLKNVCEFNISKKN